MSWKLPSRGVLLSPPTDALTRALGARLGAVAQRVESCGVVVDVGTDHGRLPIALLKAGMAEHAIAVDIHEEPLAGARARVERAGMSARMTFLLGNGLLPMGDRRADALTIAGVGGALVGRVLREQQPERYGIRRVVAQPMSEERVLRAMVSGTAWQIVDEALVVEAGRLFLVIVLEHQATPTPALTVEDVILGPRLRHNRLPEYAAWLRVQQRWLQVRQSARLSHSPNAEPTETDAPNTEHGEPPSCARLWPTDGTEPRLHVALHLSVVQDAMLTFPLSKE